MNPLGKTLWQKVAQPIFAEGRDEGQVSMGRIEINPNSYVLVAGKRKKLIDVFNIKPDNEGRYFIVLRGIKTLDGDEIWPGKDAIERINSRSGEHVAALNMADYASFVQSYKTSHSKIVESKLRIDALALTNQVNKKLEETHYRIEVRYGQLLNLGDPFMPVDPRLLENWDMSDYSKFNVYADIQKQNQHSEAFVQSIFTAYPRGQDFDTDTLMTMQVRLIDNLFDKEVGRFLWDKKFPHTTNQIGSRMATNMKDLEDEVYNPLKKYQRIIGPWGNKSIYGRDAFRGIIEQTAQVADKMSVNTYRDKAKLATMIEKTIRHELIGLFTSSQWQLEALNVENLISNLPKYLAEQFQLSADDPRITELRERLSRPGTRAAFKFHFNQGLKGTRFKGSESILKVKGISDLFQNDIFEAFAANVGYSMQDRLLSSGKLSKGSPEDVGLLQQEWIAADNAYRVKLALGLTTPNFERKNPFTQFGKAKPVKYLDPNNFKLFDGSKRGYLLDTLTDLSIRDQVTGKRMPLISVQEIDFTPVLTDDYLSRLSPEVREMATKGYFITMNGLDERGRIMSKPINGTFRGVGHGFTEKSWVLPAVRDVNTGKMIDPYDLLRRKLELARAEELPVGAHINNYGMGELIGQYSIENLRKPGRLPLLQQLAEANGVNLRRVEALVHSDLPESRRQLKEMKFQLDLISRGGRGSTTEMDIRRLIEKVVGAQGIDVATYRDVNGKIFFKSDNIKRHVAELVVLSTEMENLSPELTARMIANDIQQFPVLAAVKPSKGDSSMHWGVRATQRGDTMTSLFAGDIIFDPSRKLKPIKMAQHSLEAGEFTIGVVSMEYKDIMMERLGYKKEKGSWVLKNPNISAYGNEAEFQAKYPDEGMAFLTESGQRKVRHAVLNNMEEGVDYTRERPAGKAYAYTIKDPITGGDMTVYTKQPIETHRMLHTRQGDIRVVPHTSHLGKVIATKGGHEMEVDLLVSLGEMMSKSGMPEVMRKLVQEQGAEAERAWNLVVKAGFNTKLADNFITQYQDILQSGLKIHYGQDQLNEATGLIYKDSVLIRNLPADQQIHRFSNWGSWSEVANSYMTSKKGGEQMKMLLSGQAGQDSIPELGFGMFQWLKEQGALGEEANLEDFMDILYVGQDRLQDSGSILSQVRNTKEENLVESLAKTLFVGNAAIQANARNAARAESEAMQQLSLESSKQHIASRTAMHTAFGQAVRDVGMDNIDTLLKAFFAGLG